MKTKLLWVYEGLTEYYGFVLSARSGLLTPEISRDNWAEIADWAKRVNGGTWKEAYVYFKHDEGPGSGPAAVELFRKACAE